MIGSPISCCYYYIKNKDTKVYKLPKRQDGKNKGLRRTKGISFINTWKEVTLKNSPLRIIEYPLRNYNVYRRAI